ncbi:MAG: hypothetical protein F9K22_06145 [Bacteroidetes bacterium]|nr:MAG: hypothetical protein F9K22_06145 [Bacteroidota bacterium]
MTLSPTTRALLSDIAAASAGRLQRSMDLGTLIELSVQRSLPSALDDLAFSAKFLTKSFELMKRIGKGGEGYDRLEQEFAAQMEKARAAITGLTAGSPAEPHFSATYLSMDTDALQNVMQLFHDLGWYKNYRIDHP